MPGVDGGASIEADLLRRDANGHWPPDPTRIEDGGTRWLFKVDVLHDAQLVLAEEICHAQSGGLATRTTG